MGVRRVVLITLSGVPIRQKCTACILFYYRYVFSPNSSSYILTYIVSYILSYTPSHTYPNSHPLTPLTPTHSPPPSSPYYDIDSLTREVIINVDTEGGQLTKTTARAEIVGSYVARYTICIISLSLFTIVNYLITTIILTEEVLLKY